MSSSWTAFANAPILVPETNLKLLMDGTNIDINVPTNFNLNTTDMSDEGEKLFQGYSHELTTFASVMCIIFIVLGVPGNLITIIALARCKKVRNATAVFIINLSLSDLLFGCFNLPLAASTFLRRSWDHGDLLCRLFPLVRYGLLAVSLFTILSITINRYVMIGHPRIYPRIYRHRYLGLMVAATWICAFGSLIPTWRGVWGTFGLDESIGSCSILPDKNNNSPKEFLFIMAFIVPCFCIVVCYARIFYIVRKTAMKSHEPALTTSTIRRLGKSPYSPTQDTNRQLLGKSSRTSKEETSENSSSVSNCSYPPSHIIAHHHTIAAVHNKDSKENNIPTTTAHRPMRPYLSKLPENEMKFIDTSIESDLPPSLSALQIREEPSNKIAAPIIPNAITESDIEGQEVYVDDDVIATEIKEPNNVFHITSLNDIKREQSSNSGTDGHIETDGTPPRKRVFKKSLKTSFTRITKRNQRNSSVPNTSAASVLYPGRMSQKDRRLLKMILVIFISFIICYLPITITKIWKDVTEVHTINVMGYVLVYLTTCINPIIYVVMSSEYRQAYWNLLLCRTVARSRKNQPLTKRRSKLKAGPNPDT